jgi:hypothetical protein
LARTDPAKPAANAPEGLRPEDDVDTVMKLTSLDGDSFSEFEEKLRLASGGGETPLYFSIIEAIKSLPA